MKRKGIVKFFIEDRGFGYIRDIDNREEFYVQKKHLLTPIQKGEMVKFEVAENNQGLFAIKVEKINFEVT